MKKIPLIVLFLLVVNSLLFAQGTLGKNGRQLNAGIGFSDWGVPIYAGLDFGVDENITIGPKISIRNYSYTRNSSEFRQTLTVVSFNGNYHFNHLINLPTAWDFYAGLTLGYYFWSQVKTNSGIYHVGKTSSIGLDLQVGGRYFFSNQMAINLELGGGTGAGGSIGITYQF